MGKLPTKTVQGIVRKYINSHYFVELENGENISISYKRMHSQADMSSVMLGTRIPDNTHITLFKKDNDTFYPALGYYPPRKVVAKTLHITMGDPKKLLENIPLYTQSSLDIDSTIGLLMKKIQERKISIDDMKKAYTAMSSGLSEEEKVRQICSIAHISCSLPCEDDLTELKSSFYHGARSSITEHDKYGQLKAIGNEITAIANTLAMRYDGKKNKGQVIIGAKNEDDNTFTVHGVENEIAEFCPGFSLDRWLATVFNNVLLSYLKSPLLMQGIHLKWYNFDSHLIAVINIEYHGLPIVIHGLGLPYRSGSSMLIAQGQDMVEMIANAALRKQQDTTNNNIQMENVSENLDAAHTA